MWGFFPYLIVFYISRQNGPPYLAKSKLAESHFFSTNSPHIIMLYVLGKLLARPIGHTKACGLCNKSRTNFLPNISLLAGIRQVGKYAMIYGKTYRRLNKWILFAMVLKLQQKPSYPFQLITF